MSGRVAMGTQAQPGQRKGVLAFELLLIFPILFVLLLAMIQFSLTLYARQQLLAASRECCRVAALGGDQADVATMAKKCLGAGRLGEAEVVITDEAGAPLPGGAALPSGELVMVWLCIPHGYVVPDLLRFIGYSHRKEELIGRTVMRRE
jgi:hypothetical protein